MREVKDGVRSLVRVAFDGSVHKTFRGTGADERFANEIRVLKHLEELGCGYVPQVISFDEETLTLVTTNCGRIVEKLSEGRQKGMWEALEKDFLVRHLDPFLRNITYSDRLGCFCIIDFELAEILGNEGQESEGTQE